MTSSGAVDADRGARLLLGLAAVAVMFAAADTYVVVLALPDMMASAGLSADELQRAAPIVSGFLLGYVAILPLVGRIADLRGRVPVLVGSLIVFALGSVVTAAAYDLPSMVSGRFLQGVGGGGLVPATLALVADLYPPQKRGVPLGIVGAVQELGSVIGPLYGAVVLTAASWRAIFVVNLAAGLVLAAAIRLRAPRTAEPRRRHVDAIALAAVAVGLTCLLLVMIEPERLITDVTYGQAFLPVVGTGRWLSPLALGAYAAAVVLFLRADRRSWRQTLADVDVPAVAALSLALGCIVVAFATADPQVQVFSPAGPVLLVVAALALAAFGARNRVSTHPLVPAGALTRAPAWGSLVVSFFVGAALIAALVDIPIYARVAVYNDDQLGAALVLVRFLAALPLGALVGGWLSQRLSAGLITAAGMAAAAVGFLLMAQWDLDSLHHVSANVPLVLAGFGFGLALAPVNAALLATTDAAVHGVTSALLVVARMVGMLVGISVLATVGLRQFYATQTDLPSPFEVCGQGVSKCDAFSTLLQEAGLVEFHAIFAGAAISAVVAAVAALVLFRGADTRAVAHTGLGVSG